MHKFLTLLLLYSCSQVSLKKDPPAESVSLGVTLDHIHASYLKGCVDAYREIKIPLSFELCRDKATQHMNEVKEIIDYVP